jgi:hypothetical protein
MAQHQSAGQRFCIFKHAGCTFDLDEIATICARSVFIGNERTIVWTKSDPGGCTVHRRRRLPRCRRRSGRWPDRLLLAVGLVCLRPQAQGDWADLRGSTYRRRPSRSRPVTSPSIGEKASGLLTGQVGYAWNNVQRRSELVATPAGAAAKPIGGTITSGKSGNIFWIVLLFEQTSKTLSCSILTLREIHIFEAARSRRAFS